MLLPDVTSFSCATMLLSSLAGLRCTRATSFAMTAADLYCSAVWSVSAFFPVMLAVVMTEVMGLKSTSTLVRSLFWSYTVMLPERRLSALLPFLVTPSLPLSMLIVFITSESSRSVPPVSGLPLIIGPDSRLSVS
jgi:hypothetical protein